MILGEMVQELVLGFVTRIASTGHWGIRVHDQCHLSSIHMRNSILSWVACWCNIGVQLWAYLESWNCQPFDNWSKEDQTLFQLMSLKVTSSHGTVRNGSCCMDLAMSHLWRHGAVAAVVTYVSCFWWPISLCAWEQLWYQESNLVVGRHHKGGWRWCILVQTSSAMQLTHASRESSLWSLWWSWWLFKS
jgi:hypothetical protein